MRKTAVVVLIVSSVLFAFKFNGFYGIYAEFLSSGEVLLNENSDKLFVPASVAKLFTLLAAVENLGLDYRFETKFYYENGDLMVKGSGDPMIYPSDLEKIVGDLVKELNLKEVRNIVLDDKLFDRREYFGKGWMWDDPNPVIGALNIKVRFFGKADEMSAVRIFYESLKRDLENNGVKVTGKMMLKYISRRKVPSYIYRSQPLKEILKYMIKSSDNQIAEMIFRDVGAKLLRKGTINNSIAAMIRTVKSTIGYGINDFTIVDGPGLSRYDMVSPKMTVELLKYLYKKLGRDLFEILSYSKGSGTISGRFSFDLWGKTGTMTGVSGLAGFLKAKSGKLIVFSIFENNYMKAKSDPKAFESTVVDYLYENF